MEYKGVNIERKSSQDNAVLILEAVNYSFKINFQI